jgi:polyisoprenyl-phosphate glycosyltransferase
MPLKKPIITAIVACYGDALAIPVMHQRLKKIFALMAVSHEIIFVNDASPDDTEFILQKLVKKDSTVVAIHHTRNFGSQQAFSSGMKIARGQVVVLMDGDLQDPPELIPEFYRQWQLGFQVVYGIRADRRATNVMNFFYKAFYRLFQKLSYVRVPRDAGDF